MAYVARSFVTQEHRLHITSSTYCRFYLHLVDVFTTLYGRHPRMSLSTPPSTSTELLDLLQSLMTHRTPPQLTTTTCSHHLLVIQRVLMAVISHPSTISTPCRAPSVTWEG